MRIYNINMKNYLAIDIGASSGRHIVFSDGVQTEVYRFKTGFHHSEKGLLTDVNKLFDNVVFGIKKAFEKFDEIQSLSIDTWGVDYVLLKGDEEVFPCYSYRNERTKAVIEKVHSIIPFKNLYEKTGIQFQPFNTVYQLYADKEEGRLDGVTDFLMLPEYLNYRLTGKKVKEYTDATTTGLVNAFTKEFDAEIIKKLGLPENVFVPLHEAGETVGKLLPEISKKVGGNLKVRLCLSHDTASAVYGIFMEKPGIYVSSGTWSLLGITTDTPKTDERSMRAGYSNEGGINRTVRYQTNITGMWAVNNAVKELGILSPAVFTETAKESDYTQTVNLNDARFFNPASFVEEIKNALIKDGKPLPESDGDIANCILLSLATLYAEAISELEKVAEKTYDTVYIAGGGAKNEYLNELTARFTGKKVVALPIEATALGNYRIQKEYDL